jgi:hypothetical protein
LESKLIKNIHFLAHPIRCAVIQLPERCFQVSENFAYEVYESNADMYSRRGQNDKAEIIRQIITGKLGEWGVYYYLNSFMGFHSNEPDMEIYGRIKKSFDADLIAGDPQEPMAKTFIHVKSILCNRAKQYGLSWIMEKSDPLWKAKRPEYLAYCQILGKDLVHFYGFQRSDRVTLGEPRKKSLESKYGLYFSEQFNLPNSSNGWR